MNREPYPFCPHGAFVGGCGVDHMCFECEMGYEPETLREIESTIRHAYSKFAQRAAFTLAGDPGDPPSRQLFPFFVANFVWQEAAKELAGLIRYRNLIRSWASSPDDDRWLYTKHEAAIAEWNERSGEEQFASLPAHVLDGLY